MIGTCSQFMKHFSKAFLLWVAYKRTVDKLAWYTFCIYCSFPFFNKCANNEQFRLTGSSEKKWQCPELNSGAAACNATNKQSTIATLGLESLFCDGRFSNATLLTHEAIWLVKNHQTFCLIVIFCCILDCLYPNWKVNPSYFQRKTRVTHIIERTVQGLIIELI